MKILRSILFLLAVIPATVLALPMDILTVDTGKRFQVMDNFGASDAWTMEHIGDEWSETNKERIADLLFSTNKGIGLSYWRFNALAGINHETIHNDWHTGESYEPSPGKFDWSREPGQRWFLRAAKARGVQQFALTVYSPPLWLTRNGLSNSGNDTNSTTNLKLGADSAFAQYLDQILLHFRDDPDPAERIDFDYVLPANEPQWEWQDRQEGCRYSNADLKKLYLVLDATLRADGLSTQILGSESGSIPDMYSFNDAATARWHSDYGDYLSFICDDPQLAACFPHILTYHSYWSDKIPDQLVPRRLALGRAVTQRSGWRLWQSEYCIMEPGRDLGMDAALRMARVIHSDLVFAHASAWQWWLAVANNDYKDGLIYTDYVRPGDPQTIYPSKMFWALGNYSRFIRQGMVRVDVAGPENLDGLLASAYLDPVNKRTVLVLINNAAAPQKVKLKLIQERTAPGVWTPYITSAENNLKPEKSFRASDGFDVPALSVVTLVSSAVGPEMSAQSQQDTSQ